jgi:hypothetical protein
MSNLKGNMSNLTGRATSNRGNSPAATPTALQRKPGQNVEVGNGGSISGVYQTLINDPGMFSQQSISAGQAGEVWDNTIQTIVYTAEPTFYFDLVLYEDTQNEAGEEVTVELSRQSPLLPNRTYIVRVADSLNLYSESESSTVTWKMRQNPVKTRGMLLMTLEEELRGLDAAIESPEGSYQFNPVQRGEWSYDFHIFTREFFSKKTIILDLQYRSGHGAPRSATKLEILLSPTEDSAAKLPDEILPYYLPVKAAPPEKTAVLHILPENQNQVKFVGWVKDLKDRPSSLGRTHKKLYNLTLV